jgi:hypothetical protein
MIDGGLTDAEQRAVRALRSGGPVAPAALHTRIDALSAFAGRRPSSRHNSLPRRKAVFPPRSPSPDGVRRFEDVVDGRGAGLRYRSEALLRA